MSNWLESQNLFVNLERVTYASVAKNGAAVYRVRCYFGGMSDEADSIDFYDSEARNIYGLLKALSTKIDPKQGR
jgi:hypothetical protein